MHTLKTAQPCKTLRPFVRAYAQRQTERSDPVTVELCPAQLEHILHFELGNKFDIWHSSGRHQISDDINVIGCQSTFAAYAELKPALDSFAIFFQPTGFWRLFNVSPCRLANCGGFEGTSVLGSSVRTLWNQLGESHSFEHRVHIAEQFLLWQLIEAIEVTAISRVAQHLFHVHGAVPIVALAEASGLGLRQLERRFQQDFGMSPKVFARVARFQAAVDRKISQPSSRWVDIAQDFGYHDQMHMIHDFEKLGGEAPAKFLTQLGNMRFTALSES